MCKGGSLSGLSGNPQLICTRREQTAERKVCTNQAGRLDRTREARSLVGVHAADMGVDLPRAPFCDQAALDPDNGCTERF